MDRIQVQGLGCGTVAKTLYGDSSGGGLRLREPRGLLGVWTGLGHPGECRGQFGDS